MDHPTGSLARQCQTPFTVHQTTQEYGSLPGISCLLYTLYNSLDLHGPQGKHTCRARPEGVHLSLGSHTLRVSPGVKEDVQSESSFFHSRPSAPELTRTEWIHNQVPEARLLRLKPQQLTTHTRPIPLRSWKRWSLALDLRTDRSAQ